MASDFETSTLNIESRRLKQPHSILRTRHLACFLLLLSTLCAAQPQVSAPSPTCCYHAIAMLLQQRGAVRNHSPQSFNAARIAAAAPNLPLASLRTIWTVRPPSAHSMTVHAVTGLAPSALI
jgi:hypothetical protein